MGFCEQIHIVEKMTKILKNIARVKPSLFFALFRL